jgi:hypothetical protein
MQEPSAETLRKAQASRRQPRARLVCPTPSDCEIACNTVSIHPEPVDPRPGWPTSLLVHPTLEILPSPAHRRPRDGRAGYAAGFDALPECGEPTVSRHENVPRKASPSPTD